MSKSPLGFNFHFIRSPTSIGWVLAPNIWRKCSPSTISQSLNSRIKWTSQIFLSFAPCLDKEASIETSLSMAITYSLGKANLKGWSPYHASCQNLTLFPNLTTNWQFLLKSSHPMRVPLHKPHPWTALPSFKVQPPHSSSYFETTTLLPNQSSSFPNRYNHFPNKALLKVVSFLIPKPPLAIGAQILSHPTRWVLLSPHRKPKAL